MKRHPNHDEFLGFANSYLREAFPNPLRTGCPADQLLLNLAENPTQADPSVTEHIAICSPCFARYMQLLEAQKDRTRSRLITASRRHWASGWNRSIGLTAALVLFVSAGIFLLISRISPRSGGGPSYSDFFVDLTNASQLRGAEPEAPKAKIELPRTPLNLTIFLPVGSEEGTYQISLQSASTVVWSQSAQAHLTNHVMNLNARVDLSGLRRGEYVLTVESVNGVRFSQPIKIVKSTAPAGKSSRSRFQTDSSPP
jgi:hypothetical protein